MENKRKLSYHSSYQYADVPCLLIGNKKIAKKYGWKVGDKVKVELKEKGIYISKPEDGHIGGLCLECGSDASEGICANCGMLYNS